MIRNYFRVIHIRSEKIIIGNTQPTHNVPGMYHEGLLKVLSSGTYFQGTLRGPVQKLMIYEKNSEVIYPLLHICFCFIQKEQIFKSSKRGRP